MKTIKETTKHKSHALHFIHADKCYRVFKIVYDGKIYAPGKITESTFGKICKFEEHNQSLKVYETDMKRSNKALLDKCVIYIEFNGSLNNLFEFGVLETDLSDLPLSRKMEAYQERKEYQEAFRDEYDLEEIRINPEKYGFPSELEFDSADEYKEFIEAELNKTENEFIENMSGTIKYGNELEAEIGSLCIKHDLSYEFTGDGLYIGHDYF